MSLNAGLAAGAAAGVIALAIMFLLAPKLRLVVLYTISLPVCALAWLMLFGRTGLVLLPVPVQRPLMYISLPLAMVTVLMLVIGTGYRLVGGPLDKGYVLTTVYRLTVATTGACMAYAAMYDHWGTVAWHMLGGSYGVLVASLARSRFLRSSN